MNKKMFIIPHSHYDAAVFKTREEYLEIGYDIILDVLNLMKIDKTFKFVLDQIALIKPFLEKFPEQEDFFKKAIKSKQLEICGGMYVMPDVNIPSGESLIRQILFGKGYCKEKLGIDIRCGWMLDSFGHHPQMSQIMKKSGFDYYVFMRGTKSNSPPEFYWQGIDGTKIICHCSDYAAFYPVPESFNQFRVFANQKYNFLKSLEVNADVLALSGKDLTFPDSHLSKLIRKFNKSKNRFELVLSIPGEFFAAVKKRRNLSIITTDFNPIYRGCYSARIELKQWNRLLENLLFTAEELSAFSWIMGLEIKEKDVIKGWEPVLFNQFHDVICGCHTDKVFENTMYRYKHSKLLVEEQIAGSMKYLINKVDTTGDGVPLLVFNQLSWERTDIVECDVGFTESNVFELSLTNSKGKEMPLQIVEEERYSNGGLKKVKIIFVAKKIPSMGYEVYHIISKQGKNFKTQVQAKKNSQQNVGIIENEFYAIKIDLWNGAITSIRDKKNNWEIIDKDNQIGNTVVKQLDRGDFWEYNGSVTAEGIAPAKSTDSFPKSSEADFSHNYNGYGEVKHGQVMAEFNIKHPFGSGDVAARVRLYHNIPRIDITTNLKNNDEWVRYRVAIPTSIKEGRIFHEIPFGAIERPEGEFPAQNWIDYSNGKKGIALLNKGLPGNSVNEGIMMLSLLKCTTFIEYPEIGGYEKGIPADGGFEKGKEHSFEYAIIPHTGNWRKNRICQRGLEFNNSLIVCKAKPHPGSLPSRISFLDISANNVIVSTIKKSGHNIIIRVYETAGKKMSKVSLRFYWKIDSAFETDLIERNKGKIRTDANCIFFSISPFEIKTFKIKLQIENI